MWLDREEGLDTGKRAGAPHTSAKGSSHGSPAKKSEGCSYHGDRRLKLFSRAWSCLPGGPCAETLHLSPQAQDHPSDPAHTIHPRAELPPLQGARGAQGPSHTGFLPRGVQAGGGPCRGATTLL